MINALICARALQAGKELLNCITRETRTDGLEKPAVLREGTDRGKVAGRDDDNFTSEKGEPLIVDKDEAPRPDTTP
jgi:hypothetical protein